MKLHYSLSIMLLFIVAMITGYNMQKKQSTPSWTIQSPTNNDYQQAYEIFRDGVKEVYDDYYRSVFPPEELKQFEATMEINVFKPMWDKRNHKEHCFLVAKNNDEVIGMIYAFMESPTILKLAEIYVTPNFQRNGIGTQLIDRMMDIFKERNIHVKTLWLRALNSNQKAINLYKKLGFETVEVIMQKSVE